MEFCLKEGESEILYPGLIDMPKEKPTGDYYPIDQTGENNLNWKGGFDRRKYGIEYRQRREVKAKRQTPEAKAKIKEYNDKWYEINRKK